MIESELLAEQAILIVKPHGALASSDFERIARQVDPYIERNGTLHGLMIEAESFPGWKDFSALVSHFRFVADHHRKIEKVAAVSDSAILSIVPAIVDHFVGAEVRHFDYEDRREALVWLTAR